VLAVSRSFGDIMYKNVTIGAGSATATGGVPVTDGSKSNSFSPPPASSVQIALESPPEASSSINTSVSPSQREEETDGLWCKASQQVISKPDIVKYSIKDESEFVVLASDGLWDVVTPQESVNFVRRQLYEHGTIDRAAQELLAKALERGSSDNISILICCFNQDIESPCVSPLFGNVNGINSNNSSGKNNTNNNNIPLSVSVQDNNNTIVTNAIFSPNLKNHKTNTGVHTDINPGTNTNTEGTLRVEDNLNETTPHDDNTNANTNIHPVKQKRKTMSGDKCTQS